MEVGWPFELPDVICHLTCKIGFQPTAEGFRLTVETGQREPAAVFFPAEQYILENPAPQKLTPTAKGLTSGPEERYVSLSAILPKQLKGVLELSGGRGHTRLSQAARSGAPQSSRAGSSVPKSRPPGPEGPADLDAGTGTKTPAEQAPAGKPAKGGATCNSSPQDAAGLALWAAAHCAPPAWRFSAACS